MCIDCAGVLPTTTSHVFTIGCSPLLSCRGAQRKQSSRSSLAAVLVSCTPAWRLGARAKAEAGALFVCTHSTKPTLSLVRAHAHASPLSLYTHLPNILLCGCAMSGHQINSMAHSLLAPVSWSCEGMSQGHKLKSPDTYPKTKNKSGKAASTPTSVKIWRDQP